MGCSASAIVQKKDSDGKWHTILVDVMPHSSSTCRDFISEVSSNYFMKGLPDDLETTKKMDGYNTVYVEVPSLLVPSYNYADWLANTTLNGHVCAEGNELFHMGEHNHSHVTMHDLFKIEDEVTENERWSIYKSDDKYTLTLEIEKSDEEDFSGWRLLSDLKEAFGMLFSFDNHKDIRLVVGFDG